MITTYPRPKPTALQLILYLLRGEEHDRLRASHHKHLNIQGLLDSGWIVPEAYATSYYCDSCFDTGDVYWHENPKTGEQRTVYRCECGVNRVEPDELRTWSVVVPTFIKRLAEAMEFTAAPSEVIPSRVWFFGRKPRREFYFVPCVTNKDRATLRGFFAPHPTAVLLAATSVIQDVLTDLLPEHRVFCVESFATLDESCCRLTVDMEPILAELEPAESEPKTQRAKRGNRAANIEKLIAELKEHYRDSRNHYYNTGQLLPRPTQGELAKRIGTRQDDVSRCLADPDAVMLKLLWNQAEDIRAVLNS